MVTRRPLILAVDNDASHLARLEGELHRGFGSDFTVRGELSLEDGMRQLSGAHERGEQVAVVLTSRLEWDGQATQLLSQARTLHPDARRALLVDWGSWADRDTAGAILHAMAVGDINYYVLKPWTSPDELFRRSIAEFVLEWSRSDTVNLREVVVIAPTNSARAHEVRSILTRNGIPHAFRERGSELADMVLGRIHREDESSVGPTAAAEVIVWMPVIDPSRPLLDPTDAEIAEAWGIRTTLPPGERDFDVLVIGAGPGGLATAVYASSEGLHTLAVERESIGGQAGSSALIRNYLGFSRGVSGAELAQRGYQQAWVFGVHFVLTRDVESLVVNPHGGFTATIRGACDVTARAVVLATGVSYRRLGIAELEEFTGAGVFYGASVSEAHALTGRSAVVVGGGNSAGQAVLHLARYCDRVTLVVRGTSLSAGMSQYLCDAIAAEPIVVTCLNAEVVGGGGGQRLEYVTVQDRDSGDAETVRADGLFVMIGAEPRTDWLPAQVSRDIRGFVLAGSDATASGDWPLTRSPHPYETTVPGVFAVGDVRSGSVKRVASAVGEGSVVVSQVHSFLAMPGQ